MCLGVEFDVEGSGEVLLGEQGVLTDVGGDDLADLSAFEQDAETFAVDAHVVGHHGQILHARIAHSFDEVDGNTAEAETSHSECHSVEQDAVEGDCGVGVHDGHEGSSFTARRCGRGCGRVSGPGCV